MMLNDSMSCYSSKCVLSSALFVRSVSLLRGSFHTKDVSLSDRMHPVEWNLLSYAMTFAHFITRLLVASSSQKEIIPLRNAFEKLARNGTASHIRIALHSVLNVPFDALLLPKNHGCACITSLLLSSNGMNAVCMMQLCYVIRKTVIPLQSLSIAGNRIGTEGAIALFTCLRENQSIRVLDLRRECQFGEEAAMHAGIMLKENCSLQKLFLWGNKIGSAGTCHLAEALCTNRTLKILNISSCDIRDEGAIACGHALQKNTSLQKLILRGSIRQYLQGISCDCIYRMTMNDTHSTTAKT
eukprot:TRINITY_DN2118_c0_g2_i1.p1 TRINITY_DN2118_c0_g2~~TRINITY_DN2118_c0_g2_i1.p1  ORF type:complete len:311 (-),score=57.99 TRINITY_DN2118_c0_g2_i1:2-895(-)